MYFPRLSVHSFLLRTSFFFTMDSRGHYTIDHVKIEEGEDTERERERERERHTHTHTHIQTDRQTGRQAGRQAGRQTDR